MLTTLTEQDVRDAHFADRTRALALTEHTTTTAILREFNEFNFDEALVQFQHGEQLLKDYRILTSDRSVVGGRFDDETAARIARQRRLARA